MSRSRLQKQNASRRPETRGPRSAPHDKQKDSATRRLALPAVLMFAVALMVIIAHWPALSAKALSFDDDQYLTRNVLVQQPSWSSAGRFLSEVLEPSTVGGYYQPLTMISLMLDYAMAGSPDNLRPFHYTSLALHVANTLLVIALLYILFGQPWVAAMVGLLFGVHPMTVETIPWIGERKTLLATFFSLWCLFFYVRYARMAGWKCYLACFLLYILALMSKPTSTPLPVVMLLLDYWPLRRLSRRTLLEKIPFFMIGGLSAFITVISQQRTGAVVMPTEYPRTHVPYILCYNIFFYPLRMLWPVNLTSHYAFPDPFDLSNARVLIGVIGTCVVIPLLLISLRWTRAILTGWLIFFTAILPTMNIIGFSDVIASDKFAYLPCIGFLMIIAWLLKHMINDPVTHPQAKQRFAAMLCVVLILGLLESVATRRYLECWKDTETLYTHMAKLTPRVANLYPTIGYWLNQRGQHEQAIQAYETALRLDLNHRFADQTHFHLANALVDQGKLSDAVYHYQESIRLKNNNADVYNNLGVALARLARMDEAIVAYRKSLELQSDNVAAINNLGALLDGQGRTDEAIACYEKALRIKPNHSEAHNNLGVIYAGRKEFDKAVEHFEAAVRINPANYDARKNLATALSEQGKGRGGEGERGRDRGH